MTARLSVCLLVLELCLAGAACGPEEPEFHGHWFGANEECGDVPETQIYLRLRGVAPDESSEQAAGAIGDPTFFLFGDYDGPDGFHLGIYTAAEPPLDFRTWDTVEDRGDEVFIEKLIPAGEDPNDPEELGDQFIRMTLRVEGSAVGAFDDRELTGTISASWRRWPGREIPPDEVADDPQLLRAQLDECPVAFGIFKDSD